MPMGTPETNETPTAVDPYQGFKFDPMTGKALHAEPESESVPADENNFTHYVHLADGRVIKALGGFTHFFESDKPDAVSVPVIGVYPR